jgi:hypothetical protein
MADQPNHAASQRLLTDRRRKNSGLWRTDWLRGKIISIEVSRFCINCLVGSDHRALFKSVALKLCGAPVISFEPDQQREQCCDNTGHITMTGSSTHDRKGDGRRQHKRSFEPEPLQQKPRNRQDERQPSKTIPNENVGSIQRNWPWFSLLKNPWLKE